MVKLTNISIKLHIIVVNRIVRIILGWTVTIISLIGGCVIVVTVILRSGWFWLLHINDGVLCGRFDSKIYCQFFVLNVQGNILFYFQKKLESSVSCLRRLIYIFCLVGRMSERVKSKVKSATYQCQCVRYLFGSFSSSSSKFCLSLVFTDLAIFHRD